MLSVKESFPKHYSFFHMSPLFTITSCFLISLYLLIISKNYRASFLGLKGENTSEEISREEIRLAKERPRLRDRELGRAVSGNKPLPSAGRLRPC